MSRPLLFAANWKMHLAPGAAGTFLDRFLAIDVPRPGRTVAFFPPAISLETIVARCRGREHCVVGAQNIYWEAKGAFTGEISAPLVAATGGSAALIGHSERRHLFGETDVDTNRKLRAVLDAGLLGLLCVGEKLLERERDETEAVVTRQLRAALGDVDRAADLVIAYEPVWAIGSGRTATSSDAAVVHVAIRGVLQSLGFPRDTRVLYGGSVTPANIAQLVGEPEIDGVLVGGAALDPDGWARICAAEG